jgi:PAS domain S-box-containing protein
VVQVLERALDHRLGRVHQLRYSRDGVLWARLSEGIARVAFPSPISHFEPLLASSLAYAKPVRHDGHLWLLADGRAMRGVYDEAGRLTRFVNDAPVGRYVFHLKVVGDDLFATSDAGVFVRRGSDWALVATGVVNARIGLSRQSTDRIVYAARDEIGVLTRTSGGFTAQRTFVPNLGDCYSSVEEASGIVWLELGAQGVARLDPRPAQPQIEIFGPNEGLANGWAEIYTFDGIARFHLPNRLYRFDESARRFVEDHALLARHPALLLAHGRPVTDREGTLWYTSLGVGYRLPLGTPAVEREPQPIPVGFGPSEYTLEDNGVVWMFFNRWLARFDPRMAPPPAVPLRAIVTTVQFTGSSRNVFTPAHELDPVPYTDNSLVFSFAAPANPFAEALSFEVLLEGASAQWVSTGSVGTATFNRLKEGDYVFRVRPVAGGKPGEEARVAFTVRPPWYRTTLAWALYSAAAFILVGCAAWFASYLQRRENERLENLVASRTEELNTSNQRLGRQIHETTEKSAALTASEERYRLLNAELEHRVRERTAELSSSNEELLQRESLFRLIFEHAPVGILWKRADLGDMYHFNPTFRRILRLPVNAPADDRLLETLAHPDDAPRLVRMYRIIATGEADSFTIEQRFVLHDASVVWAALSVAVVRDKEGHILQDIGILEDITGRKKAEAELAATYKNLMEASRMAGMAEVATGVLHNVGNVLNSLNVSANLIADGIRQSKADSLVRLSALLHDRAADLGQFLANDPKGRLVPEMLDKLSRHSVSERDWLVKEIASMQQNIDHIKEIVAMQQSYATVIGVVETLDASTLFEDALRMNTAALMRHDVTVIREYLPTPPVRVEKGKVLQILINLIRNAKYACDDAQLPEGTQKIMTVRVEPGDKGSVRLLVRDNGVGISTENLTRIFAHGFTTRAYGHGFGLHSSALAAKEMKGSLTAYSDGPGQGATFVLEIPATEPAPGTVVPEITRDAASRAPFGVQKNAK